MKKKYIKPCSLVMNIQNQGDLLLNSWDTTNSDKSMDDPTTDMGVIRQDQGSEENNNIWGYDPWKDTNW